MRVGFPLSSNSRVKVSLAAVISGVCLHLAIRFFRGRVARVSDGGIPNPPNIPTGDIVVVYASVSGTAARFALFLQDELRSRGGNAVLFASDATKIPEFLSQISDSKVILFIIATAGEGRLPPTFTAHWDAFCNRYAGNSPTTTSFLFSVLALGDQIYPLYCEAGRKVMTTLSTVNTASPLLRASSHDAAQSKEGCWLIDASRGPSHQEAEFLRWLGNVCDSLFAHGLLPSVETPVAPPMSSVLVEYVKIPAGTSSPSSSWQPFPLTSSMGVPTSTRPCVLPVTQISECLPPNSMGGRILHVTIDASSMPNMSFESGDHCGLHAPNPRGEVLRFLRFFCDDQSDVSLEQYVRRMVCVSTTGPNLIRAGKTPYFPVLQGEIGDLVQWHLDICGPPRVLSIQRLIRCCRASAEWKREKLNFLQSLPFDDLVASLLDGHSSAHRKSSPIRLVDVLSAYFPLCSTTPLHSLFECIPRMQPRFYSIGSDPLFHGSKIHVYVRVVGDGVATLFLSEARPSHVVVFIRKSEFHLPRNTKRPLLLIGPGTGIAPLFGFLYRRLAQVSKHPNIAPLGAITLYHGCRQQRDWDFYFKSLCDDLAEKHILTQCIVCLSQEIGQEKTYVQHRLMAHAAAIAEQLKEGMSVFVCGDAQNMAKAVRDTFTEILQSRNGMSREGAITELQHMIRLGRYAEDVW